MRSELVSHRPRNNLLPRQAHRARFRSGVQSRARSLSDVMVCPLPAELVYAARRCSSWSSTKPAPGWNAKKRRREGMSKLPSLLLVVALISVACASTSKAVATLEPGMTTQQILAVLGSPADRSFRGRDEAWQYQEIAGFGQCKYTTLWISNSKLVGVSTRRGASAAGCGLGSREVDWSQMPSADERHN